MKKIIIFLITFFIILPNILAKNLNSNSKKNKWFAKISNNNINYFPIKQPFKNIFYINNNDLFNSLNIGGGYNNNSKKYLSMYFDLDLGFIKNFRWNLKNQKLCQLNSGIELHLLPDYKIDPFIKIGAGYNYVDYRNKNLDISKTQYFMSNRKNFGILDSGLGVTYWILPNLGITLQSCYNHVFYPTSSYTFLDFWKHNIGLIHRFSNESNEQHDKQINKKIINHIKDFFSNLNYY